MKQLWSRDAETIEKELSQLIDKKAKLFCYRAGSKKVKEVPVKGGSRKSATNLFVLYHPHEPSCAKRTCLFYYHLPGHSIKCFEATRRKKVANYLGLEYPKRIYRIQRRQFARITVPHHSPATFTIKNKQRINYGTVENISINGAYITCDLPSVITKGNLVNSLSMSLYLQLSPKEETNLQIPEAKVTRMKSSEDRTKGIGVQFMLSGQTKEFMENYLEIRNIEIISSKNVRK